MWLCDHKVHGGASTRHGRVPGCMYEAWGEHVCVEGVGVKLGCMHTPGPPSLGSMGTRMGHPGQGVQQCTSASHHLAPATATGAERRAQASGAGNFSTTRENKGTQGACVSPLPLLGFTSW
jgi:hypothetical protein